MQDKNSLKARCSSKLKIFPLLPRVSIGVFTINSKYDLPRKSFVCSKIAVNIVRFLVKTLNGSFVPK